MNVKLVALIAALTIVPLTLRGEPKTVGFSEPDGPDRAEVAFTSQGCFHHSSEFITIFRSPPSAEIRGEDGTRSISLSMENLTALDRLFDFYRSEPNGGCTTVDEISVTWFRADEKLKTERFIDASCLTTFRHMGAVINDWLSPEDRKAVEEIALTIPELVNRKKAPLPSYQSRDIR